MISSDAVVARDDILDDIALCRLTESAAFPPRVHGTQALGITTTSAASVGAVGAVSGTYRPGDD